MRIALSMRVVQADGYREPRDAISHDWIRWLDRHGHVPILLPNGLPDPGGYLIEMGAHALVLTGGNDVAARPGGEDTTAPQRTATETAVLGKAIAAGLPVLGTCRGLHLINVYFGGTIASDVSGSAVQHVANTHTIALGDAFAALANGRHIETNSFHIQGVTAQGLASELRAFATCEGDGLVEGLHHPTAPILAVQWHPERPNPAAAFDNVLIARFLERGAFWSR